MFYIFIHFKMLMLSLEDNNIAFLFNDNASSIVVDEKLMRMSDILKSSINGLS